MKARKIDHFFLPGIEVEDYCVNVPLDWRGKDPQTLAEEGLPEDEELWPLFWRVLRSAGTAKANRPYLIYLQGGPGCYGPRPLAATGWLAEALKHFQVVLLDQRGTGRSGSIDGQLIEARGAVVAELGSEAAARSQADFLKRFLALSIVKDYEFVRHLAFDSKPWYSLGQSYGGFLTMCYLSFYPEGLKASFISGGVLHIPGSAEELYQHSVLRMAEKTKAFYERYPEDAKRLAYLADYLEREDLRLPDGERLTARRLQMLGQGLGAKPGAERLHQLLDTAFAETGAEIPEGTRPSCHFLMSAYQTLSSYGNPLYWTLQEFIYANSEVEPIRWAAERACAVRPEFSPQARPLMLTGEAIFSWLFDEDPALRPFKAAMEVLMEDREFDPIYDPEQLAKNTVPLQAMVYFDDLYVPSELQLDTLSRVGSSHAWVSNEYEHDGLTDPRVFARLLEEARNRGDLEEL
ncbi:MAG: alpha/beta fold hydrolase [Eubacteriales bacterium]|nr:alpha/beta fold hydrolase [Eubacteriales bacterium]